MRSIFAPALATALLISAPALAADSWTVDHSRSSLEFVGRQGGNPFTGTFGNWSADILFSPDDLEGSSVTVTIDLATVATGSADRDGQLPTEAFFHVAAHPQAIFTASDFSRSGDGYEAEGELTLKGITAPVTLTFTFDEEGDQAIATGSTTLDRSTFSVGTGSWASPDSIALEVEVQFSITAARQ